MHAQIQTIFWGGGGGGPASDQAGSDLYMPRVESSGRNLGHFKHLYSCIMQVFHAFL